MKIEEEKKFVKKESELLNLEYKFIEQFIKIRKNHSLTQQELANNANVIRETVSRIENMMTSPQLNTLIKLLEPVGYTITITPIEKSNE